MKLKECPICRKDNTWCLMLPGRVYKCRCGICGCQTWGYDTEAEAIATWNERVTDPRLQKAVNQIVGVGLTCKNDPELAMGVYKGLQRALGILRKHIPELMVEKKTVLVFEGEEHEFKKTNQKKEQ